MSAPPDGLELNPIRFTADSGTGLKVPWEAKSRCLRSVEEARGRLVRQTQRCQRVWAARAARGQVTGGVGIPWFWEIHWDWQTPGYDDVDDSVYIAARVVARFPEWRSSWFRKAPIVDISEAWRNRQRQEERAA